jgi:hypothetical protein
MVGIWVVYGKGAVMNKFDRETIVAMRKILEEACIKMPREATSARAMVASRILDCASKGGASYDRLLASARRAVDEEFRRAARLSGM